MKKVLIGSIVLMLSMSMVVAFSLNGCKAEEAPEEGVEEAVEEAEEVVEEGVEEEDEKVSVEFFNWQWTEEPNLPYFKEFLAAFNDAHPGIELNMTGVASGEYNQKLLVRSSAGDAPDVFTIRPTQLYQLIDEGILQVLDEWINQAPWKDNLLSAIDLGVVDGSYYATNYTHTPQALVYNEKILKEAGVNVPTTPEELYNAAKTIYDKTGLYGYACISDINNIFHMNIEIRKWVWGFGGSFSEDGYPSANSPETVEGVKFYKKLYDAEFTPKGVDSGGTDQLMYEEKAAMSMQGAWLFGSILGNAPDILYNFKAALPPTPTHTAILGGAYMGMSSSCENKDAAWEVINFFNSKEWQEKYLLMTSQIPGQANMVTEEVLEEAPWWEVYNEAASKYAGAFGYMSPGFEAVADEYNNEIGIALADILEGGADVETRLNELQETLVDKFVE